MEISAELSVRAPLNCALISGASILQTKRHGDITISPERGYKRSLYLIFYNEFYLMIASCGIQKRQKLAAGRRINHLINTGQSKRIFGACLVQASVIDTHVPGLVLLDHEDWVCQPLGADHPHDEACSLKLGELFADCSSLIFRKTSKGLLDRFRTWPNVDLVLGEFPRHSRHVLWRACKDVPVLTEELDELAFLFVAMSSSDQNELGWAGGI